MASLTSDIGVPGLNKVEWFSIIEKEQTDDFIDDLITEILDTTADLCYKKYIEKQLNPYAVNKCKEIVLKFIKWQFLDKDPGNEECEDESWGEVNEPEAPQIDSWARGVVPIVRKQTRQTLNVPSHSGSTSSLNSSKYGMSRRSSANSVVSYSPKRRGSIAPSTGMSPKQSQPYIPYQRHLSYDYSKRQSSASQTAEALAKISAKPKSSGAKKKSQTSTQKRKPITSSKDRDKEADKRLQADALFLEETKKEQEEISRINREAQYVGHTYDHEGKIIGIKRLNPDNLPKFKVKAQVEFYGSKKTPNNNQSQTELNDKGKKTGKGDKGKNRDKNKEEISSAEDIRGLGVQGISANIMENIQLVPGVTIREGENVKKGPMKGMPQTVTKYLQSAHGRDVKPVPKELTTMEKLALEDIVEQEPIVRTNSSSGQQ
eukprot:Nk52_evm66s164 gene=Nk52_evmTU66s164